MPVKTLIQDGGGTGTKACVTSEKALLVSDLRLPPENVDLLVRPFRGYLRNSAGILDMRVDGSVTPVEFVVNAAVDGDRYIDSLSIIISDANASLNQFGALSALNNGIDIFYEDPILGNVTIANELRTNFDFVRLCGTGTPAIGSSADAYRASNVDGNSEGYIMTLDFSDLFNIPWGVKLSKGTLLRLGFRINDDITGVDAFNVIAAGFDRILK